MADPESRFLQNQEARTAALRKKVKNNHVVEFWRDHRGKMASWNQRLAQQNYGRLTAAERQGAINQLESLQKELKEMQKNAVIQIDLPVADLCVLHNEFASCAQRLQDVRDVVSPPTRFVFSRYRAAWKEYKATKDDTIVFEDIKEKELELNRVVAKGRSIRDLHDAVVVENEDGRVHIAFDDQNSDTHQIDPESIQSMSLVLQNLYRCQVSINVGYYLLHLINVNNCDIRCFKQINGAIHITSCTSSTITATCHQLRIHESQGLHCHIAISSRPILEDSSNITFHADPGDTMVREAKDFNWFHSEPSPNFKIVENSQLRQVPETSNLDGVHDLGENEGDEDEL